MYPLGPEEKGRWHLVGTKEAAGVEGTGADVDRVVVVGATSPMVGPLAGGELEELEPHVID